MNGKPVALVKAMADALRRGATGAIVSAGKMPTRKVWVRKGHAIFVDSADPKDRYTQVLARYGALTKTEVLLIEEEFSGPGVGEEQAILASDMVPSADLREYARKVFEERLLAAFELPGAIWSLVEGDLPEGVPEYPMPLVLAILRGIRERYTVERLKLEFPVANDDHYSFERGEQEKLGYTMSKVEDTLSRALDGEEDWATILAETKLSPKDAHAALFAMAVLGVVSYSGNAAPTRSAGSGRLPESIGPRTATVTSPAAVAGRVSAASTASPVPRGSGRAEEMKALAASDLPVVLGLPEEAAPAAVQQAFKALVGKYDLGRAHQLPESDREAALALLDRAADAYLVMTHPKSRSKYFDVAPWDREATAIGLAIDLAAEKHFLKAGIFLQAGNCLAAEASLLPALQLEPRESRFHLRMGIAIYQRAKARGDGKTIPSGAARALEKAAAFDPKNFEPWLFLGHVALANGDKPKALGLYQHAAELNPSSEEAKRAASRLEAR